MASGGLATLVARAGDQTLLPAQRTGEPLLLQEPGGGGAPAQPPPKPDQKPGAATGQLKPPAPIKTLIVPIGSTQQLKMSGDKVIKTVLNPKENIALVQAGPTERVVLVTGREAGTTRVTLIADDLTQEVFDILVQFDVEYLRIILQRVAPTANLTLSPASGGVIVIGGTVNKSEDIEIIMRTAQSVAGAGADRIINAMTVGGVMQVQLDVVVAFVSRSELRRMAFDFLDAGTHHNFSSGVSQAIINPTQGSTLATLPGIGIPVSNTIANAPNGAPANFFLGLFNSEQVFYGLLQVLRDDNLAKILAEPKLVTMSGRSADLLSGGQQAIPESAGLGSVSVRFEPFGTRLGFLPIVLGNGKIQLEVEPEVSNIDPSVGTSIGGTVVPGRNTQRVHTTVIIEDGQTLAIGGLIQNQVVANITKVPVIGDLPYLGAAFSSKSFKETESELVVLVTPHLVDPMACNQLPPLVPGQETRSPDDCELFLEGILEAPRGPRDLCPGGRYMPAFKNGPTYDLFPCAGNGHSGLGRDGCATGCNGSCGRTGSGTAGNHMTEVPGKPLPVTSSSTAPGGTSKSADSTLSLSPSAPAALPLTDSAKAPVPAVQPSETAGENQSAFEPPAKASKLFHLPWVGEGSGPKGTK
jgi:pilus assembly protein CpaC